MVENWIEVESTPNFECRIIFQGKVNVTLDDDDVNYLLSELLLYKKSKDLFESFRLGLLKIK